MAVACAPARTVQHKDAVYVARWSAAVGDRSGQTLTPLGHCAEEATIPPAYRRRMGAVERAVARCVLGVLTDAERTEIVLSSRFGNLGMLIALLQCLADGEPVSPTAFSFSVHNVLAGVLGQIRGDRSAHTAIACGRDTLAAGIVEAWCKLTVEPGTPLVLVFCDGPLPPAYRRFADADDDQETTVLAVLLRVDMAAPTTMTLTPAAAEDDRPSPAPARDAHDGSHRLVRRVIECLQTATPLTFGARRGSHWRLGPP